MFDFQNKGDIQEKEVKKNDWTGYDRDLVEALERDIISQNPNVRWLVAIAGVSILSQLACSHCEACVCRSLGSGSGSGFQRCHWFSNMDT